MAKIVLGLATAHSPQCTGDVRFWKELAALDRNRLPFEELKRTAPKWLATGLTDAVMEESYRRAQVAIKALSDKLMEVKPDVLVVIGDDQHELFLDECIPTFAVYIGKGVVDHPEPLDKLSPSARDAAWARHAKQAEVYPNKPEMAKHILSQLIESDFDVAQFSTQFEGRGVGHSWTFARLRLQPDIPPLPTIPITINAYFPPNQPSAKRCFALGRTVRKAIESWDENLRVALIATGGLSHRIIDEEFDQKLLKAMAENDVATIEAMPRKLFVSGTAECLNWIATAGAAEHLKMKVVDYVPAYRSEAGSGVGMGFVYWQ